MSQSDPMRCSPLGETFFKVLQRALPLDEEVLSLTLTGSICQSDALATISDVDTIVVVSKLTEALFNQCIARVASLTGAEFNLPDYRIQVNPTFGPLKFDTDQTIIIHLMIYDLSSHRHHVLKSPFTCYSWERSPVVSGLSLRQIYPVIGLSPDRFLSARRSIGNYLQDLAEQKLSYREYRFPSHNEVVEETRMLDLDERHKAEYAYHIVKNLVINYAKCLNHDNETLSGTAFFDFWNSSLDAAPEDIEFYKKLEAEKQGAGNYPVGSCEFAEQFLQKAFGAINAFWKEESTRLLMIRHAKTELNTGQFLGQGRDPGILEPNEISLFGRKVDAVYCSPFKRTEETATQLFPEVTPIQDPRLSEIDYGEVEGLLISELPNAFPELANEWAQEGDPQFPGGESSQDVVNRIRAFIESEITTLGSTQAVVTHNVVIRCVIGCALQLPKHQWWRIPVEHVGCYEFFVNSKGWFWEPTPQQLSSVSDALKGHI